MTLNFVYNHAHQGGVAGLMICLFAKLKEVRDPPTRQNVSAHILATS